RFGVAFQSAQQTAAGHVPQLDGVVDAGGCKGAAVGAEGDRKYPCGVALERAYLLAGGHVPEIGVVRVSRGQGAAVGREGDGLDGSGAAIESAGLSDMKMKAA